MKSRRRWGARAAGVAVLLLAVPLTTASAAGDAAGRPGRRVTPDQPSAAALAEASTFAPTTTAPPPPTEHCPVASSVEFVDSWGNARSGGRRHQGIDMLAPHGTPVLAPVDGHVEHRNSRVGGMSYHLTAADGTYYYGTHLSGYDAAGWVAAGTVIGYVGDTGNARGTPHLHFEIHPGGQGAEAVNPYPTVLDWCTPG